MIYNDAHKALLDSAGPDGLDGEEMIADLSQFITDQRLVPQFEEYLRARRQEEEGCDTCEGDGLRFPSASGGNTSRPWVERCDACDLFHDDWDAAAFLAGSGYIIGYARNPARTALTPAPYVVDGGVIRALGYQEGTGCAMWYDEWDDQVIVSDAPLTGEEATLFAAVLHADERTPDSMLPPKDEDLERLQELECWAEDEASGPGWETTSLGAEERMNNWEELRTLRARYGGEES